MLIYILCLSLEIDMFKGSISSWFNDVIRMILLANFTPSSNYVFTFSDIVNSQLMATDSR